jgi:membrane associated rhomboid family serine protease
VIALVIVGCYVRTALAGHDWISIPSGVLIRHGANLPRGVADGEWWRHLTSTILHVGLWHIGFNLLALAVVGPHVERNYGRLGMPFLFVLTGVLASIGSQLTGMWGAGASGAIMGMIGAIAGAGQRSGTTIGKQERNAMLRWAVYTIIFGIGVGADNHAHVGGFVVGAAFGLLVPTEARTPRWVRIVVNVLGALSIAAILGAAALVMWPPAGAATSLGGTSDDASALAQDVASCKMGRELDVGAGAPSSVEDACAHVEAVHAFCTGELPAFFATATPIECQMMRAFDQSLQIDPRAGRGE